MTRTFLIVCACIAMLPVAATADETAPATDKTSATVVITVEQDMPAADAREERVSSADCSGNTITIVNTGTRIATGGGNAAGVSINGSSITVDGKTMTCD